MSADPLPTVTHGSKVFALPFAGLFRALTAAEETELRESIRASGVLYPVHVYDSDEFGPDCLIDGANRARIAAEEDADLPIKRLKLTDDQARELAEKLNTARRQLTPAEIAAAKAARVVRVAEKRAEGKSLRAIAEEEKVSLGTVQNDLADADESGVCPYTPEPDTPKKVTGRDGKRQAAKKKPGAQKPGRKPQEKPKPAGVIVITEADEKAEKAKREQPTDAAGTAIPPHLRDTFFDAELPQTIAELTSLWQALDARYQMALKSLSRKPYKFCHFADALKKLADIVNPKSGTLPQAIDGLKAGVPHVVCVCAGKTPTCKKCRGGGVLPEWRAAELAEGVA